VLERIGKGILPELEKLSAHRDPLVRRRALSVAGKIAAPESRALLERGLGDAELSVREGAMLACAQFAVKRGAKGGGAEMARKVIDRLGSASWQERVAAARATGELGPMADRPALERAAVGDKAAFVREAAVVALGRLGAGSLDTLLKALDFDHEKVPEVRLAAAVALGKSSDQRARAALTEAARRDPDASVKAAAQRAVPPSPRR